MALVDLSLVIPSAVYTIGSGSNLTFNKVSTENMGSKRREITSDSIDPYDLVIRHQQILAGKEKLPADRHLIQIIKRKHETTGEAKDLIVNLTVQKPQSTLFTNAEVVTRLNTIANLLVTSGYMDAFLRGES